MTEDEKIIVGDSPESETDSIGISCYFDSSVGCSAILVDTPGFDDSRVEHNNSMILTKIANFLLEE